MTYTDQDSLRHRQLRRKKALSSVTMAEQAELNQLAKQRESAATIAIFDRASANHDRREQERLNRVTESPKPYSWYRPVVGYGWSEATRQFEVNAGER